MAYVKPAEPTGCSSGKVLYPSYESALAYLARCRRWAAGMEPYRCGPCRGWHVGHSSGLAPRKKNGRRR